MKIVRSVFSLFLVLAAGAAVAQTAAKGVDRLYILDCGTNSALDQARWSPGVNVGKPLVLSDNCYLLRHGSNYLLWELAYSELVFTDVLWPDFRRADLFEAVAEFQRRERRFGSV